MTGSRRKGGGGEAVEAGDEESEMRYVLRG